MDEVVAPLTSAHADAYKPKIIKAVVCVKRFNVTGTCVGMEHYMVDISKKLDEIEKLVDGKRYFVINRARQYGKTTTLFHLSNRLNKRSDLICARITFEDAGLHSFDSEKAFCEMFLQKIAKSLRFTTAEKDYAQKWNKHNISSFGKLSDHITDMCEDKKLVLMIDEVDKASNHFVFLKFLSVLRAKFLSRQEGMDYTFHSVILAGVTDIKNLKLKMISNGHYEPLSEEEKIISSPWNIAASYNVDMSFNCKEISAMLGEYETDAKTGMDITGIAEKIHKYTSGYPFLVSRICQCIDEELNKNWSVSGVEEAVRIILGESNVLFDDMVKNLENYKNLHEFMYELLILGETKTFVIDNPVISLANTFGYIKKRENGSRKIAVSNRIFESRMTFFFVSKDENMPYKGRARGTIYNDIVQNGKFDMVACLLKFAKHYREIYSVKEEHFFERHGRLLFISFLTPLLNGQGFIHIETQLTDERRMDLVVDFEKEQFIVELKLWKGDVAKERAYKQLLGYMETKNASEGYLLTFDFRKQKTGEYKAKWVEVGKKKVFDVVV